MARIRYALKIPLVSYKNKKAHDQFDHELLKFSSFIFLLSSQNLFKIFFHPFEKAFFVFAGVGFKVW